MSKKGRSMVDYYGFLGVACRLMNSIRSLAIADLIFFAFFLFGVTFFGGVIFMQTFVATVVMIVELVILVSMKLYELKNADLFGTKKLLDYSTDKVIQILRNSKKILAEVEISDCDDSYKELDLARHEMVKAVCCKSWLIRTEEESDALRRIKTTGEEEIKYLGKVLAQKDEFFDLYDDDLKLKNIVFEQYNRVKAKLLEWPKVISK